MRFIKGPIREKQTMPAIVVPRVVVGTREGVDPSLDGSSLS